MLLNAFIIFHTTFNFPPTIHYEIERGYQTIMNDAGNNKFFDALTAYRWLLARGTRPGHIVLAGDSAGGGLALSLLESLRDKALPMSAGAVLLSPWTDLVGSVASRTTRNACDPIFTGESINALANFYAGTEDKHNPLISPINADLQGFPPLRIDVGSDEVLLDDSLQVADHAKAANVPVEKNLT
jgi:epsilon-lactone hydrolase